MSTPLARMSALVLTAALMVAAAGCGGNSGDTDTTTTAVSKPDPYALTKYSIIWSDTAGLDLMSPEGTYVRASVESLDVSTSNGDRGVAVPGFWESVTGPAKEFADSSPTYGPDGPWVGIMRYQILQAADHGNSFEVIVCTFVAQRGTPTQDKGHPDGTYEYRNKSYPLFLTVQRQGHTPPPSQQSGPDTFVTRPVFGTWKTVDWHTDRLGEANTCQDNGPWPGEPPWPALTPNGNFYVTTDIPAAPSYPGWSDGL
ncbi:hypothetical protein [Mycolicibacterium fortuitum]|uniref:hypothetical protein n=1 Tax=Mycolicibacterium fortuitum TaxID=1766 RepID=UPI00261172FD|nr:hypothetical protein [Mycolicibacterium fortuitum]